MRSLWVLDLGETQLANQVLEVDFNSAQTFLQFCDIQHIKDKGDDPKSA